MYWLCFFRATRAGMGDYNRDLPYGLQSLQYLLSGLLQKMFADSWSKPVVILLYLAFPGSNPAGSAHVAMKHKQRSARGNSGKDLHSSYKAGILTPLLALNLKVKSGSKSSHLATMGWWIWKSESAPLRSPDRVPDRIVEQLNQGQHLLTARLPVMWEKLTPLW